MITVSQILFLTIVSFIVYGMAIVAHELGHVIALLFMGARIKFTHKGINVGVTSPDLKDLSNIKKSIVAWFGILLGWLPIILFTQNFPFFFVFYTVGYIVGCSSDIILIIKLVAEK